MVDDIKRKKTEKLADQGFLCLKEERFDEALKISNRLEKLRYTAAFDIGAQAYCALGEMDKAIETLRRGVEVEPNCWLNLQLLGNYLSDIEEYDEADTTYNQALKCDGVWEDSIRLNQAILANRQGNHDKALSITEQMTDEELQPHVAEIKVAAYRGNGRIDEAIELADASIQKWQDDEDAGEIIGHLAASIGRMWLQKGKARSEVRNWALNSLDGFEYNGMLLALIRDIDDKYSEGAQYFRILADCMIPVTHPSYRDAVGYFITYHVVADTVDESLEIIREFEDEDFRMNLRIEESEILEPRPDSPKGVYWYSERGFYESDN